MAAATDESVEGRLILRVLSEYREMPGLALTKEQACRLWGCDAVTCARVIDALVAKRLVGWTCDGRLIRAK